MTSKSKHWLRPAAALGIALALAIGASACSGGDEGSSGGGDGDDALATVDPASLAPADIIGEGPYGEAPESVDSLKLTDEEIAKVKSSNFKVGIVMQTLENDWGQLQVQGVTDTLEKYGAEVIGVTDGQFKPEKQISDIENMIQRQPDAIVTIPVDNTATAPAYKKVADAGIKLVFMLQPPKGLQAGKDYATVVSQDMEGSSYVAAEALAEYIPEGGTMGILDFGVDFFTTNVRTAAVKQWVEENRPDIKVEVAEFIDPSDAESVAANFLTATPDLDGLFAVWDLPAMAALSAMRQQGKEIPITTLDLGNEAALEMAKGGAIKALGAQEPYDQGIAEAEATLKALLGKETPPWVVLPAVPVTQQNLLTAYEQVWHTSPPANLTEACESSGGCGPR